MSWLHLSVVLPLLSITAVSDAFEGAKQGRDLGVVTPVASGCLGDGARVWRPVLIPEGLGIRRVIYKLDRAENSIWSGELRFRSLGVSEPLPTFTLGNYDPVIYEVRNPDIRNGIANQTLEYFISGVWSDRGGHKDFQRIEPQTTAPTYHEISYFANCEDPYRNTWIKVEFSNSDIVK
jgi:hypothetical protein